MHFYSNFQCKVFTMKSILKYLHSPVKINKFHVKLFSFLKFRDAITAFHFKNNVLFNKVKEWYIYFSGPNEVKHLKDILIKQVQRNIISLRFL